MISAFLAVVSINRSEHYDMRATAQNMLVALMRSPERPTAATVTHALMFMASAIVAFTPCKTRQSSKCSSSMLCCSAHSHVSAWKGPKRHSVLTSIVHMQGTLTMQAVRTSI